MTLEKMFSIHFSQKYLMDTALTPQPPLMSPDIPFSAFRTLNLAEEIFFEALPLLPP